ncbi:MAG: site-specific DNA-methyltransferase [Cyclobacteriaceae bacterium]|nr:site-specific DNA-methyltransferase [Cyclobacteriaceae bacterium]
MGNIELIQGDCLEKMKDIPDESIDMILCDLPYGTTKCKWDTVIPFDSLWKLYKRCIKSGGVICLFGAEPFSSYLRLSNIKMYRYDLIWNKQKGSNPLLVKKRPMSSHENISIFYDKFGTYNPQLSEGKSYKAPRTGGTHTNSIVGNNKKQGDFKQKDNEGFRYPLSILPYSIHCGSKLHPTQKPLLLCEHLIKTYTNEGDTVLDNCMGSGTTGVACKNLNRNFIGIELDPEYFKIADKRINENL